MSNIDMHNVVYENHVPTSAVVFSEGRVYVAAQEHPNFGAIVAALEASETPRGVVDLFDIGGSIARRFRKAQRLLKSIVGGDDGVAEAAEKIEVRNGQVFWEGQPVHDTLAGTVMAYYRQNSDDFLPLVRHMAKVMDNPNEHSRTMMFDWMRHYSFKIAPDGDILAYKGVRSNDNGDLYSTTGGHGFVNGDEFNGRLRNNVGDKVRMPREEVTHDPSAACSSGLHVGTVNYASQYGDTLIQVKIDPRDVVSVPTDSNGQKMRVCGYEVVAVAETVPVDTLDQRPEEALA